MSEIKIMKLNLARAEPFESYSGRVVDGKPVNTVDIEITGYIANACGGELVDLSDNATRAAYCANPDKFAADYFGLSVADYRQWIELTGHALCAGKTKAGKPCAGKLCGNTTFPDQFEDSAEWKRLHRRGYCKKHSK